MDDPNPSFYWMRFFKKVRLELVVFSVIIGSVSFLMPREALVGLFSLLAAKVLTLTLGTTLAHLLRIIAFPYLNLSQMIEDYHWSGVVFLALWYFIIIYSVAVGG
jgi:hypothetical protein